MTEAVDLAMRWLGTQRTTKSRAVVSAKLDQIFVRKAGWVDPAMVEQSAGTVLLTWETQGRLLN